MILFMFFKSNVKKVRQVQEILDSLSSSRFLVCKLMKSINRVAQSHKVANMNINFPFFVRFVIKLLLFVEASSVKVNCFVEQAPLEALNDPFDAVNAHIPEDHCRFVVLQLSENNP